MLNQTISAGADPGFHMGDANPPEGAPTYEFAKISKICMKLRKIWTVGGGVRRGYPFSDPPLKLHSFNFTKDVSIL